MKKWTHLYVFVILSSVMTLYRGWSTFFTSFNEEQFKASFDSLGVPIDEATLSTMRASVDLQTSLINKILVVLMLLALIAVVVLLVQKKNELASYTYVGYLFATLIMATYNFVGGRGIGSLYSDPIMRQGYEAGLLGGYGISVVLFLIYFGLTVFFHLRKPKEVPSLAQNATDI